MIHNISYRVFVHGTENEEKVLEALNTIFPYASPERELTEGYYKNKVIIFHQKFTKKKEIKNFLENLKELEPDSRNNIIDNLEKKMDDHGNLFLRFSKQDAFSNKWKIVEHGDSIHTRIKFAAYPAKKEGALKLARELFD